MCCGTISEPFNGLVHICVHASTLWNQSFPSQAVPPPAPSAQVLYDESITHLLDVDGVRQDHGQAVNTHAPASSGWETVLQGRAERLVNEHRLVVTLQRKEWERLMNCETQEARCGLELAGGRDTDRCQSSRSACLSGLHQHHSTPLFLSFAMLAVVLCITAMQRQGTRVPCNKLVNQTH